MHQQLHITYFFEYKPLLINRLPQLEAARKGEMKK